MSMRNPRERANICGAVAWALVYAFASIAVGMATTRILGLPAWITPAMAFNNTTSLPLLLVTSLATTGVLAPIAGDDVGGAINRVKSYFLVNSMVSNTLTFGLGPLLIGRYQDGEDGYCNEVADCEADEETSLLPRSAASSATATESRLRSAFSALPSRAQTIFSSLAVFVTPPLLGAILAVVVGLVPALHRVFFANMQDGGWLHAWLTSSIKNVGELFVALQMFIVGGELYKSFDGKERVGKIPTMGLVLLFAVRFVLWPV